MNLKKKGFFFVFNVFFASPQVRSALNIGTQLKLKTKSYIWWTNDPWAAFIAAAGIVFVLALVGIVVLLNSYKR